MQPWALPSPEEIRPVAPSFPGARRARGPSPAWARFRDARPSPRAPRRRPPARLGLPPGPCHPALPPVVLAHCGDHRTEYRVSDSAARPRPPGLCPAGISGPGAADALIPLQGLTQLEPSDSTALSVTKPEGTSKENSNCWCLHSNGTARKQDNRTQLLLLLKVAFSSGSLCSADGSHQLSLSGLFQ